MQTREHSVEGVDLHFRSGQLDDACDMLERYHYSRRVPSNVQFVGSLHKPGGLFGDGGEMVAAAFFSIPPTRWSEDVLELSRLVRGDNKVNLSKLLSQSLNLLRKNGHHLLVSFADRTQGHHGGVYMAASWIYGGCRKKQMDGVMVDGVFIPGRSANGRWGTRSPKRLAALGVNATPHYDMGKNLFYKPLSRIGKARARRLGLLNLPYFAACPDDDRATSPREAGGTPASRSNTPVEGVSQVCRHASNCPCVVRTSQSNWSIKGGGSP